MEYSSSSVSCNLQPGVIYHIFSSLLKSTVVTESSTFRLLAFPTVSITGLFNLYIPKHGPEESNKLCPKLKDTVPILRTNSADCYSRAQCSSQEFCKHQFLRLHEDTFPIQQLLRKLWLRQQEVFLHSSCLSEAILYRKKTNKNPQKYCKLTTCSLLQYLRSQNNLKIYRTILKE